MATYRCPDNVRGPDDVVGCGHVFDAEPDHEGLVDCPNCGIWFNPKTEPATVVSGVQASAPVPQYRCIKCGYKGPQQVSHQRPNGSGECGYIAARVLGLEEAQEASCFDAPGVEGRHDD